MKSSKERCLWLLSSFANVEKEPSFAACSTPEASRGCCASAVLAFFAAGAADDAAPLDDRLSAASSLIGSLAAFDLPAAVLLVYAALSY